jgi:hypothetical protein
MGVINTGNKIGTTLAGLRLVMATVFSLSLVGSGTALILKKNKFTKKVKGKVTSTECDNTQCKVSYEYSVDGNVHRTDNSIAPLSLRGAKAVDVSYNPDIPGENTLQVVPTRLIGLAMYGLALLFFCVGLLTYMVTKEVKGAGTAFAALSAYKMLTN